MKQITLAIGADHRGFEQKAFIQQELALPHVQIAWSDVGAFDDERSDYPLFAERVCKKMLAGHAEYGVLLCGTGVGMAMAANRFKKIYAALAWNQTIARLSREDDNANILVFPSDFVSQEQMVGMLTAWLHAEFQGGRYQKRVALLDELG